MRGCLCAAVRYELGELPSKGAVLAVKMLVFLGQPAR